MNKDVAKILVSEEEIDRITTRIAAEIDRDYAGEDKRLILLCILKGSIVFMGDLMKKITVPVEIDCMKVSSYGAGTVTTGSVNIHLDLLRPDLDKCDILIVEDIVDTGSTCKKLTEYFHNLSCNTVEICTLLNKPSRRTCDINPKYIGYDIEDKFIIGYGFDYNEKYRNIPYIGVMNAKYL